jgi:hypothetical protein
MTTRYIAKFPPTRDMGSYKTTCSGSLMETHQENALWDYNSARAHDGLPPLSKCPAGTVFEPIED